MHVEEVTFKKVRMRLIVSILILSTINCLGQITGSDKIIDKRAIVIDDVVLSRLHGDWLIHKTVEVFKNDVDERKFEKIYPRFKINGDYDEGIKEPIGLSYNTEKVGTWVKANDTTIKITPAENHNFFLKGSWVIYESTDSTMTLTRVLTSNGDWQKQVFLRRPVSARQ